MKSILSLIFALFWATLAAAECCRSDNIGRCGDNSVGTPCCATGQCNIFCCNCDGSCRWPSLSSNGRPSWEHVQKTFRKAGEVSYDGTFEMLDTDRSNDLSLGEYLAWVAGTRGATLLATNATLIDLWIEHFARYDVNGDGKIQLSEIHRPY